MAKSKQDGTPEEDIFEFLDRLDIDVNDVENINTFQNTLDDLLRTPSTPRQRDMLFNAAETKFLKFAEVGIERVQYQIGEHTITRFVIPFQRGLFGLSRALDFAKNTLALK